MPFDSWGSSLEGKISDLNKWIDALENAQTVEPQKYFVNLFTPEMKAGILRHLRLERDSLQRQLNQHRQRDRESGIKY